MVCWRSVTQSWGKNTLKSLSSVCNHEAVQNKPVFPPVSFRSLQRRPEKKAVRNQCRHSERLSFQEELLKGRWHKKSRSFTKAEFKGRDRSWQVWTLLLRTHRSRKAASELLLSTHMDRKEWEVVVKKSLPKKWEQEKFRAGWDDARA